MLDTLFEFLSNGGFTHLSWVGVTLTGLVLTQVTIAGVTIYLHRHQAHRALDLHPVISHFFRFWLWMTTGMVTREWVAVHRKHHAKCETPEDPHSPQVLGIRKVMWEGSELYRKEATNEETLERYGHLTPADWVERHVYARFPGLGVTLMLLLDVVLFGSLGLVLFAVQMVWIPFWAAGVINGVGHWWGYRNFETPDASRNITPLAIIIGGEELHANHHAFPASARFSCKWWEFDLGWLWIRLLSLLGLARVKKVLPRPVIIAGKHSIDMDTVRAVVLNRMHVMANYAREVMLPVLKQECRQAEGSCSGWTFRRMRALLIREPSPVDEVARHRLDGLLAQFNTLRTVYQYRQQLQAIWARKTTSQESLIKALQEWCLQAEATGISSLREFAGRLRGYSVKTA
jgi:stearoyl-CoA desaturase (delta-9 desaturase)